MVTHSWQNLFRDLVAAVTLGLTGDAEWTCAHLSFSVFPSGLASAMFRQAQILRNLACRIPSCATLWQRLRIADAVGENSFEMVAHLLEHDAYILGRLMKLGPQEALFAQEALHSVEPHQTVAASAKEAAAHCQSGVLDLCLRSEPAFSHLREPRRRL